MTGRRSPPEVIRPRRETRWLADIRAVGIRVVELRWASVGDDSGSDTLGQREVEQPAVTNNSPCSSRRVVDHHADLWLPCEIMTMGPVEDLLRRADLMWSITDRAVRSWRLGEWALLYQVRADNSSRGPDPARFVPDKGSSLARDDSGFMPELGEMGQNLVSSTARVPAMTAAENLVGASQVHGAAIQQKRTNNVSTGTLCRSAIENAAKTIWLICDPSREIRRARCLGYTARERSYQKPYIEIEEEVFAVRTDSSKAAEYQTFLATKQKYEKRHDVITSLPEDKLIRPPRKFENLVAAAAKWIDDNPPPHVTNADGLQRGMTLGAQRFYAFGSSFVHGYKWMSDYVGGERDVLAQISDGLAAAVIMTECAVALFEAQATHPARSVVRGRNYPPWLEPTVAAWRPRYQQSLSSWAEPPAL